MTICTLDGLSYHAEEFRQSSSDEARQHLRSASTSSHVVPCTRLSTVGFSDRRFPAAEQHVGAVTELFSSNA